MGGGCVHVGGTTVLLLPVLLVLRLRLLVLLLVLPLLLLPLLLPLLPTARCNARAHTIHTGLGSISFTRRPRRAQ